MNALPITIRWEQVALTAVSLAVSFFTTIHVLLRKKDTKAAIGWIGLIWLSPFIGSVLYVLLGINRIERKARSLRRDRPPIRMLDPNAHGDDRLHERLGPDREHLVRLSWLGREATGRRLLADNRVTPLDGGDEAYPAMIRAIDKAERSITLLTYIFRFDSAGTPVAEALDRAKNRGVEIRILIDALGSMQEGKSIVEHLRSLKLLVALSIPTFRPGWMRYANLRNHRKVMVIDGRIGFTGGMNILDDFLDPARNEAGNGKCCRDLHFEIEGPVVTTLQQSFADDWAFITGEVIEGDLWYADHEASEGETLARIVVDGPDIEEDPLEAVLFGALAVARESATILTPYFIPDPPLTAALISAAQRGVLVDIFLPKANNHRLVKWAGIPLLEPLLEAGCRILVDRSSLRAYQAHDR